MRKKYMKPKALRQIEDCMNDLLFEVNDQGQLVMSHPEKFTRSEIELLKILFSKQRQQCDHKLQEA